MTARDEDFFFRHGLTPILNMSGTETFLGAVPVCEEALAAVEAVATRSVSMVELQSAASRTISRAFGSEAGIVAHSSAAAIATAVAAAIVGTDRAAAELLPDTAGLANEVVLQRGHNINYGGSIAQNVAMTGARLVEIGAATETRPYQLEHALTDRSAAALFVVSHHTVQTGMIGLGDFCGICHDRGIPVIVDAAAEPDPRPYLSAGADLVISSMQKPFRGLTAATIAGRLDLVRACHVQAQGIARAMKCSKETVASTIAVLEKWSRSIGKTMYADLDARLRRLADRLRHLPGLHAQIVPDAVSGVFARLHLHFDPRAAPVTAQALARRLVAHNPSIHVRTSEAELGILQVDLRHVSDEAVDLLVRVLIDNYAGDGRAEPVASAAGLQEEFPVPPRHHRG